MQEGEARREQLLQMLRNSTAPISGSVLARSLGVSRQVIVQDIALLRAKASEQGIAEIKQQDGRLLLTFSETDFARLSALCGDSEFKGRLLLNAGSTPYLSLRLNKGEKAMEMAQTLVDKYAATAK